MISIFNKTVRAVRDLAVRTAPIVVKHVANLCGAMNSALEVFAKYLLKGLSAAKNYRTKTAVVLTAVVVCLSATVVAYAAELKSAVEVRYGNRSFGYVADMEEARTIADTVRRTVHGKVDPELFSFESATAAEDSIVPAGAVVSSVCNNADGIVLACGLYVDGKLVAIADDFAAMQAALDRGVAHYTADGFTFQGYANSVVLRDIFATEDYAEKLAVEGRKIVNGDYGIQFKTQRVEQYDEEIAYSSVIEYNDSKNTSYEKVTQKGENGLRNVTANVLYINGVKVEAQEIESTVVKSAVDRITVKGTKKTPVSHNGYVLATSIMSDAPAQMLFPVECNGRTYISSFWGDNRGHKAIDIAAPKGSEIYAAADGTVSYVGRRSDYGNLIIIDHNDGKTQTLYSHNSKNLVSEGDKVTAGQLIALVGATGNATGNHLHFAVIINGTMVDPAPYVGLK